MTKSLMGRGCRRGNIFLRWGSALRRKVASDNNKQRFRVMKFDLRLKVVMNVWRRLIGTFDLA